ncbi:MAG: hypothetical protein B6I30_03690 [Desulfobacteraceae bacterium 4572_187]|nr:MAG: hypothetical protein B6I30_03690 [Desulfobacteraceae bacterium 4572_187]
MYYDAGLPIGIGLPITEEPSHSTGQAEKFNQKIKAKTQLVSTTASSNPLDPCRFLRPLFIRQFKFAGND